MFVDALLCECLKFSKDIVVSYGSHFYNGEPEDLEHMQQLSRKYPDVKFTMYAVDVTLPVTARQGVVNRPTAYWHNLARWTAVQALAHDGWVYVIDADEIPDGSVVAKWLEDVENDLVAECCYKNACYWYFKTPENQATTLEDSVLLIHKKHLTRETIFGDNERDFTIESSKARLLRQVKGLRAQVMWHHFSFVRSKECMIRKLTSWAHANDMFKNVNAIDFVNHVFRNDDVNDVVHGYNYNRVENKFGLVCL
jgi:hypothetical protein